MYLVRCNRKIYLFLISCIDDAVNRYNALDYINYNIYIYLAIGIVLFIVVYWLLKYKDKPRNIYIISILVYIIVGIYMFVLFGYFSGLPNSVIDQKVIRAYRDIMLMTLGAQYLIIIIMLIRGLGFDIKKFNFSRDAQELNLVNEDGEEVEVDVNIDATNIMRGIRKQRRELGYFFQEYKIFILGILFIIILIVGYVLYNYISKEFKVYNQNEVVGYMNSLTVKNSYYNIDTDKKYIIISFDISRYGREQKLDVNSLAIEINGSKYVPNKNICYNFDFLGNCYKKQYITDKTSSYILVYEVDDINSEKSYLIYKESDENVYKVKLDLENYE